MYPDLSDIHIGEIIGARIRQCGMSYAEFARRLCIDRTTVYGILKAKSIDVERLVRIGRILDYDFLTNVYLRGSAQDPGATVCVEIDERTIEVREGAIIRITRKGTRK